MISQKCNRDMIWPVGQLHWAMVHCSPLIHDAVLHKEDNNKHSRAAIERSDLIQNQLAHRETQARTDSIPHTQSTLNHKASSSCSTTAYRYKYLCRVLPVKRLMHKGFTPADAPVAVEQQRWHYHHRSNTASYMNVWLFLVIQTHAKLKTTWHQQQITRHAKVSVKHKLSIKTRYGLPAEWAQGC